MLSEASTSSKGFGNGFVSGKKRFDDLSEFYEKYRPGPGNYKSDTSCSLSRDISTSISYKSLYNAKSVKSLKIHKEQPGPGFYNPIMLAKDFDKTLKNFYFKSELERFHKTKIDDIPGPGNYFKHGQEKIKDNTVSYFFKKPIERIMSAEEKLINEKKDYTTPGPGAYELRTELLKKTENNIPYDRVKEPNTTVVINKEKNSLMRTDFYDIPTSLDKIKTGEKTANYKSSSPRFAKKEPKLLDQHIIVLRIYRRN